MILDTSILEISGSIFVRIPPAMVKYYKIKEYPRPGTCSIEDIGNKEAKLTFSTNGE